MQVMEYTEGKSSKELRSYQQKIINVLEAMEKKYDNFSTIVELATGGGKTYTATRYILQQAISRGHKVLWLTHRDFLLNQAMDSFKESFNKETSPNKNKVTALQISGKCSSMSDLTNDVDIIFASIASMKITKSSEKSHDDSEKSYDDIDSKKFFEWLKDIQENNQKLYIVIDEAHHVCNDTYDDFLQELLVKSGYVNNYALIGLTATPFREDHDEINFFKWFKHGYEEEYVSPEPEDYLGVDDSKLTDIGSEIGQFGNNFEDKTAKTGVIKNKSNKVKVIDIYGLLDLGVILEPDFIRVEDFDYKEKREKSTKMLDSLVENILKTEDLGKTVVFASTSDEAESITKKINSNAGNYHAELFLGKTLKRDEIIEDFKDKDNIILVTVDVLSEGFDIRDINTIILINGTHSKTRLRQRIGRVVRKPDEDKNCRVIWYYYKKKDDDVSTKVGEYVTDSKGFDLSSVQSKESLKADIARKTYYLTAPEYKENISYQQEYDCTTSKKYRELLNILDLFKDNDALKDYIGYYDFDGYTIYVDEVLNNGIIQLSRRVHTEYLICKQNTSDKQQPVTVDDIWGTFKSEYIKNVMEICFFLCKPSRRQSFYITKDDIEEIVKYLLKNNCKLPRLIDLHGKLNSMVTDLFDNESKPLDNVDSALQNIFSTDAYNELISSEKDKEKVINAILEKLIQTKIAKNNKEAELANNKAAKDVEEAVKEAEEYGEKFTEEERESKKFSSILEGIIDNKKKDLYPSKSRIVKREHDYNLRLGGGAFDAHLKSLYNTIKTGAVWNENYVTCKCSKCNKDVPIVKMVFDSDTKSAYCKNCNEATGDDTGKITVIKEFETVISTYTIQVFAQCLIENTHRLIVTEEDVTEFKDTLISSLQEYSVQIDENKIEDLIKDIICALAYDNEIRGISLRELINLCNKLPRYLAYLLYDRVYREVCFDINFIAENNGVRYNSYFCQNEDELIVKADNYLAKYNLSTSDLINLGLNPVQDAINDNAPYVKVLQSYQGIKPDLLCRMNDFIINQVKEYDTYLCGCGGSGADLINLRLDKPVKTEYFNEYGYAITAFYSVLKDEFDFTELQNKVTKFVNYIINPMLNNDDDFKFKFRLKKDPGKLSEYEKQRKEFEHLWNTSSKELGSIARKKIKEREKNSSRDSSLKREREKLLKNPVLKNIFYTNGVLDEDAYTKNIVSRENILHGIWERCQKVYDWLQSVEDTDIEKSGLSKVDIAFIVFVYLSFPDRQLFDNCFMYHFLNFAASYQSYLEMGHERVKDWVINEKPCRDIIKILGHDDLKDDDCNYSKVNKDDKCVAYCDIPYAETDSEMYVDGDFKTGKFIEALDKFKGYYIVSSRYNICAPYNLKKLYYAESENKEILSDEDRYASKLRTRAENVLKFYYNFWSKEHKLFEGKELFRIDNKGKEVENFYKGLMSENRTPKYIVMPFTAKEEIINDEEGSKEQSAYVLKKRSLNYRMGKDEVISDVEKMLKRTFLSNLPVEVMITNIDMFGNKDSKEHNLLEYYKLNDNISVVPTLNPDATSRNYFAEPIYVVMKYDWYLEKMFENVYEEGIALQEAKEVSEMFRSLINS